MRIKKNELLGVMGVVLVFVASLVFSSIMTARNNKVEETSATGPFVDSGIDYSKNANAVKSAERGWRRGRHIDCDPSGCTKDWGSLSSYSAYSIFVVSVDLSPFSGVVNGTGDLHITQATIDSIEGYLQEFRAADATVIIRFSYDAHGTRVGDSYESREPALETVWDHIEELEPVFANNSDVIMYVETGMFGPWGEQHSTDYMQGGDASAAKASIFNNLINGFLDVVPSHRTIGVRQPMFYTYWLNGGSYNLTTYNTLYQNIATPGTDAARVGLYNDGYLGNNRDLGTFRVAPAGLQVRENEVTWLSNQALRTFYGGEADASRTHCTTASEGCENGEWWTFITVEHVEKEAFKTHTTYLNDSYHYDNMDYWKGVTIEDEVNGNVTGPPYDGMNPLYNGTTGDQQTVFKWVGDHLGYRLYLTDAQVETELAAGDIVHLSGEITNEGFAPVINEKAAELVVASGIYTEVFPINFDIRDVVNGTPVTYNFDFDSTGMAEGDWDVYLRFREAYPKAGYETNNAVTFANTGVWNATLKGNYIGTITLGGSTPVVPDYEFCTPNPANSLAVTSATPVDDINDYIYDYPSSTVYFRDNYVVDAGDIYIGAGACVRFTSESTMATVSRGVNNAQHPMFENFGSIIIDDLVVDGNKANVVAEYPVVYNYGNFLLKTGGIVQNNDNIGSGGGGVSTQAGSETILDGGQIINNIASEVASEESGSDSQGGGILVYQGDFYMYSGLISGNVSDPELNRTAGGGGVFLNRGTFYMYGGTISNNDATKNNGGGGGIYVNSTSRAIISGGLISGNAAIYGGGGLYVSSGNAEVGGSVVFTGNTASEGSAISTYNGATLISGGEIHSNLSAPAIYVGGGSSGCTGYGVTITGGGIYNNSPGGIYARRCTLRVEGGVITGNSGSSYSALRVHGDARVILKNKVTIGTNASDNGIVFYATDAEVYIEGDLEDGSRVNIVRFYAANDDAPGRVVALKYADADAMTGALPVSDDEAGMFYYALANSYSPARSVVADPAVGSNAYILYLDLQLSLSAASVRVEVTPGMMSSGQTDVTVRTNAYGGYKIYMEKLSDLTHTDGVAVIPSLSDWAGNSTTWGYRNSATTIETDVAASSYEWKAITLGQNLVRDSASPETYVQPIYFGVKSGGSVLAGDYTATVVFTVVANL